MQPNFTNLRKIIAQVIMPLNKFIKRLKQVIIPLNKFIERLKFNY